MTVEREIPICRLPKSIEFRSPEQNMIRTNNRPKFPYTRRGSKRELDRAATMDGDLFRSCRTDLVKRLSSSPMARATMHFGNCAISRKLYPEAT